MSSNLPSTRRSATTAVLLLSVMTAASAGAIYKWVDASGQVHYSQTPPPGAPAHLQGDLKPAASLDAPPPLPADATASGSADANAGKTASAAADSPADRAKRCSDAQARVTFLQEKTAHRLAVPQPDGSLARMTDEQFADQLGKAQQAVASNCGK